MLDTLLLAPLKLYDFTLIFLSKAFYTIVYW